MKKALDLSGRSFCFACAAALWGMLGGLSQLSAQLPEKPNIILVMGDDHGWGDVGYNGLDWVRTETLDSMAKEGLVFDRFYAAAPVCSPTRASVLTGRHPMRSKVASYGNYMDPHEHTLAEAMKSAGYVTGLFGKFHIGSGQPGSPCNPGAMGFDEWVIGLNYFDNDPYLSRNGTVEYRKGKGTAIVVDDAIGFLKKHRNDGKPLFMLVWFPSPHHPHAEVPDGPDPYEGKPHPGYYREITLLDQQLGRLRNELRSMNLAENTILWYCSDNGGLVKPTSGGREMKGSIYEGGLRVPSIVEWPAKKLKGRVAVPASTCDFYPTLLAMAGIKHEAAHVLDGMDLGSMMTGGAGPRGKAMGFWGGFGKGDLCHSDPELKALMEKQQAGEPMPEDAQCLRITSNQTKPVSEDTADGHAAWNDWPWKLHRIKGTRYELYHLENDPMETTDLAQQPEHRERVQRMRKELDAWMRSVILSHNGKDYAKGR